MKHILKLDAALGRHMGLLTLAFSGVGLLFPGRFAFLAQLTPYFFVVMAFSSSLGCGFRELGQALVHPKPILTLLALLHVVLPLCAFGIGTLCFPNDPLFVTGMVLQNSIPTGVVSLMWVALARGNNAMTLCAVLLDALLTPIATPLTLKLLLGSVVQVNVPVMMRDLILLIAAPALLAMLCNHFSGGRVTVTLQPKLAPAAKLALFLIAMSNANGIADFIWNLNGHLTAVMLVSISLVMLAFFIGYCAARLLKLDYPTTLSVSLGAGLRNINAGAVLAMQYFSPEVLFPVVTSSLFVHAMVSVLLRIFRATKAGRADQAAREAAEACAAKD